MTELHNFNPIASQPHRVAVVFVHGIDGDYETTWGSGEKCWGSWLKDSMPNVGVYSFSHEATKGDYINIFSHEEIADKVRCLIEYMM